VGSGGRARAESGQASPEWIGLVLVVALFLSGLISFLAPLPIGALLARVLGSKLICAVELSDSCRAEPALAAAYGSELAAQLREHAPTIYYEKGMRALPVDFRSCRAAACADAGPDGSVWHSAAGQPASAFVHVIDCRAGTTATFAGLNAPEDCEGPRAGHLYLQYWLYYPDSATLRGVPVAGKKGYHRDDWEGFQVRVGGDGSAAARASSHHGFNYGGGAGNWASDAGVGPLQSLTDAVGLHADGGWGPDTGALIVSGGSHAGHVSGARCCRVTPGWHLNLIPADAIAAGEGPLPHFTISPPWEKHVWFDPEAGDTG
jgi:hypothetical protein